MAMDKGWKDFEKRIALAIGGRRIGILGKEDVEHEYLSIEAKLLKRDRFPKLLIDAYGQAKKNCPEEKIPVLCMKPKNILDKNAFVILSLEDFRLIMNVFMGAVKGK